MIPDKIRPVFARLLAIPIAALVAWLAAKFGLNLDDKSQAELTRQIVEIVIAIVGIFLGTYAAAHKAISVKTNPTDAASPKLVEKPPAPVELDALTLWTRESERGDP